MLKKLADAGTIRLKQILLFLANPLPHHLVSLEETDDGIWSVGFCHLLLAKVAERDMIVRG